VPSKTEELARFAATLSFDDIPTDVVHQAARLILDTCGCAVAGNILDNGKRLAGTVAAMGGVSDSTIVGTSYRAPVGIAALANTQLANMLDLDDNLLYCSHFGNAAVMPAFAMAEREHASGRDLVTAVVAGFEVTARVMLSLSNVMTATAPPPNAQFRWNTPAGHSYNVFAATSGAGRILGLDAGQMANAFGIGGYTTVPQTHSKASAAERMTDLKLSGYGWMAWSGVLATLLAREGMTGDTTVLDGPHGFWRFAGYLQCDFDVLTEGLGDKWWIMDTSFKPYPAGTWMRNAATALDHIVAAEDLAADEIDKVVVRTMILRESSDKNLFTQDAPRSAADTQVSYLYTLAMRILRVPPHRWHAQEIYGDPIVGETIGKIELVRDGRAMDVVYEETLKWHGRTSKVPATVEVYARGLVFDAHAEYAKGDPFDPETRLSDDELVAKFQRHTHDVIGRSHGERATELLLGITELDDVCDAAAVLTP
jgi:2-methylcitrate dehydratase PrpD